MGIGLSWKPEKWNNATVQQVYVPDLHLMTLTCLEASEGECRVALRGGPVTLVRLRPGQERTIAAVPPGGATCSGGPDLDPATCAWQPIEVPART